LPASGHQCPVIYPSIGHPEGTLTAPEAPG